MKYEIETQPENLWLMRLSNNPLGGISSLTSIYRNTNGWNIELAFIVTYMRTGRKSSAPGGLSLDEIEAFRSKLLITLQQLRIQTSLSLGALYILIFWSSFCASYKEKWNAEKVRKKTLKGICSHQSTKRRMFKTVEQPSEHFQCKRALKLTSLIRITVVALFKCSIMSQRT